MSEVNHSGHRQRLKERYRKEGLFGWSNHEVLELLLSYAVPRKDTNALAHKLTDQYRTLSDVFNATLEELMLVPGVGPESATLIKLCIDIMRHIEIDKAIKNQKNLDSLTKIEKYCKKLFINLNYEVLFMLCLNSNKKLLSTVRLSEGTLRRTEIDVRRIIAIAIASGCAGVVLTHNHPGGIASPSNDDVVATNLIKRGLNSVDIELIDHIIVTEQDSFAMSVQDFLM